MFCLFPYVRKFARLPRGANVVRFARGRACACAREAGRSKLKRGTMPSCQRSVRPPTILPPVLRTSQRPRAAFPNFFQKLRD